MAPKNQLNRAKKVSLTILIFFLFATITFLSGPALADNPQEAKQLAEKSKIMFESIMTDHNFDGIRALTKQAKGVFLVPQLLKGAFVLGASGGSGLLVVRDEKTGQWNGPAFYTLGGVSWGLQIGGESSEVVLLLMTSRGVASFLSNNVKLGADVGVALGPIGVGASAATANLSADVLSFSRSKGLYGGFSLSGAVVVTRDDLNNAYYGNKVSTLDILIHRRVTNPQAQELLEGIANAADPNKDEIKK
jgi:SH3 domain-containing YSC84-like protein 1